jgi:PAS domain S-box-containing protein
MSIKTKIVLILAAFIVVPGILISLLVYQSARRALMDVRITQLRNISVLKREKVETFFSFWKDDIRAAQNSPDIRRHFATLIANQGRRQREEYRKALEDVQEQMQSLLTTYGYLNIILTDTKGRVVYSSRGPDPGLPGMPAVLTGSAHRGGDEVLFSPVYRRLSKGVRLAIIGAAPLRDLSSHIIGAIIIERDMEEIFRFVSDATGLGTTGEVVLARRDGNDVLFINPLQRDRGAALDKRIAFQDVNAYPAQQAVLGNFGAGMARDYSGEAVLAAWQYIPSLQWGLVAKIDADEAFSPVRRLRDLVLVVFSLSLAFGFVATFVVAKGVSEPILKLQKGMEVIGSGDLDHRVGTLSRDEVGQLSRLIDVMTSNLKRLTARRDELDAEIAARQETENRTRLVNSLLKLFTEKFTQREYLDEVCDLIRRWSGLRHVGIRILGPDRTITFESCRGYNDSFLETERELSPTQDPCICARVITGVPETSDRSFMTLNGSFYSGDTSAFVAGLGDRERKRYRGACMRHGYESLAVVPIRYRDIPVGAIHLADERTGMASAASVEVLEQLAPIIGEAVYRFDVERQLRSHYDALQTSEAKYRRLVEDVRDIIFMVDRKGTVISLNLAFEAITGLRRDDWTGKHFTALLHPDDIPRAEEIFRAILTGQRLPLFELRGTTSTGEYRYFEFQVTAEGTAQGPILGTARDVTERRLSEERLRLFLDLINQSSDAIYVAEPATGMILEANEGASISTGYGRDELRAMNVTNLAERQVSLERWHEHVSALREKGSLVLEDSFRRKDGGTYPVEVNVKYIVHDKQDYVIAVIRDITERKRAEEDLARLASAVGSAADAIVITSPSTGVILYVNPAYELMTGYGRDELLGRTLHFLEGVQYDAGFYQGLRESLARDGFWTGRLKNRRKDGSGFIEECSVSPVKNSRGEVINYVYVKRDITEKLRLESIAESVSMMDTVGSVFAGVRHEIGNPINSLNMLLGILRSKLEKLSSEDVRSYLKKMTEQIGRVEYVLRSLKSFNLFETQEPQDLRLPLFLKNFVPLVSEDMEKRGITLETKIDDGASAFVDPRALQQVLLNIVTNAADAVAEARDPRIGLRVEHSAGKVRIRIRDNGCGISSEKLERIFTPFYTTKQHGTGLGLVIVKKMLARMDGTIDVKSRLGEGTIVTITLPGGNV